MYDITENELKTYRTIAKPGRKIPLFDDDELLFLLIYYLSSVVFFIFGLGMIPDIIGVKISEEILNIFLKVIFIYVPVLVLVMLKIFKVGKQEGFVFQKLYMFITSNTGNIIDHRNSDETRKLGKIFSKKLSFLKNKETYAKNPKFKNFDIYWDAEKEKEKIKILNQKIFEFFEEYINEKNKRISLINYNLTQYKNNYEIRKHKIFQDIYKK